MDQVKIGQFIGICRREKNLTQRQLADLVGVSDKAVSKWETGRGLPEASSMVPLCEALGINVNELLRGERIPGEEYQEKAEETMVKLAEMKEDIKKVNWKMDSMKKGIGFGAALAMVVSYQTYSSIALAIVHGILGWIYVIYHVLRY
ncbi:MAG: helix-turn-helix transcriptional regulator [Lachnospiraceae bacterium]|nr:helix-turn-helix transcriptional regulator [Lachnospiraceae bacterium]